MVDLAVLGISIQGDGNIPMLLLHPYKTSTILRMRIDPMEAFAISTVLHTKSKEVEADLATIQESPNDNLRALALHYLNRPMIHDLLLNITDKLDGSLQLVKIFWEEGKGFFSEIIFTQGDISFTIPCRPADGVALAMRSNSPIYGSHEVVGQAENMDNVLMEVPERIKTIAKASILLHKSANTDLDFPASYGIAGSSAPSDDTNETKKVIIRIPLTEKKTENVSKVSQEMILAAKRLINENKATSIGSMKTLTDEEKWLELLSLLAPETKVRM